ncbi:DUF2293 domain-containing protein [Planctomycetota bacterium]|nr:DUF2293 domain-containing protein [Planctomycetota bacterium]
MAESIRIVAPCPHQGWICSETKQPLVLPEGWALLPPGDAAHTGRVKKAGAHWVAQEKRGRRVFSRGVLAPADLIERVGKRLKRERATPEYTRKLEASRERAQRQHEDYVVDFRAATIKFLDFAPRYADLARALADRVTAQTTPVGSGTVGRTKRIELEEKVRAAAIAWLRHATTNYDHMQIERAKGKRREVRRNLAKKSRQLLDRFRRGDAIDPETCRLHKALKSPVAVTAEDPPPALDPGEVGSAPAGSLRPVSPEKASGVRPRATGQPLWQRGLFRPAQRNASS